MSKVKYKQQLLELVLFNVALTESEWCIDNLVLHYSK